MNTSHTLFHPLTGEPLVPLGFRKNGLPIWPILGASEGDGGDAGDGAAGDGDQGGDGGDSGDTGGVAADGKNEGGSADETDSDKAKRLEAEVAKLRRENASSRTAAKAKAAEEAKAELAQTIGKALGIVQDGDQAPTVEELTKQLEEQKAQTSATADRERSTAAELVVWRNADSLGVDATAVTDSLAFVNAIKDLDPSDEKFAEAVKTAAQEAAEKNPKLKATQGAGSSSADHGGSGGGTNGRKPVTLDQAVAGHYGT